MNNKTRFVSDTKCEALKPVLRASEPSFVSYLENISGKKTYVKFVNFKILTGKK